MAYRGDAAGQVAQATPDQAQAFGDKQVPPHRIAFGMVNVLRPFGRVRVRAGTEAREQRELKMVVRVDHPRQDLKPAEIQIDAIDLHVRNRFTFESSGRQR